MITTFLYDGAEVVLDRVGTSSTVDYLNGAGIDEKLRQLSSGASNLYFLHDHLGSTTALTDGTGSVIERQQYEGFGASAGSTLTRYSYTGRELDATTGLIFYRARWYDPQQGRFLSEDPIGFRGGLNLYAYIENDPLSDTDPLGLIRGKRGKFKDKMQTRCFESDSCAVLEAKIAEAARGLWARGRRELRHRNDPDAGHDQQLQERIRSFQRCIDIWRRKCLNCPPGSPSPVPDPVLNPQGPVPSPHPTPTPSPASGDNPVPAGTDVGKVAVGVGSGIVTVIIIKKAIGAGLLFTPAAPVGGALIITP